MWVPFHRPQRAITIEEVFICLQLMYVTNLLLQEWHWCLWMVRMVIPGQLSAGYRIHQERSSSVCIDYRHGFQGIPKPCGSHTCWKQRWTSKWTLNSNITDSLVVLYCNCQCMYWQKITVSHIIYFFYGLHLIQRLFMLKESAFPANTLWVIMSSNIFCR
jgi:hypothetical protein